MENTFFIIFGLVALYLIYQVVKNKGIKGAMFGARIIRTIGELELGRRGMVRTRLKVHRLDPRGAGSPEIGLELFTTMIGSFHMTPVSLTREEAMRLGALLSEAVAEVRSRGGTG